MLKPLTLATAGNGSVEAYFQAALIRVNAALAEGKTRGLRIRVDFSFDVDAQSGAVVMTAEVSPKIPADSASEILKADRGKLFMETAGGDAREPELELMEAAGQLRKALQENGATIEFTPLGGSR